MNSSLFITLFAGLFGSAFAKYFTFPNIPPNHYLCSEYSVDGGQTYYISYQVTVVTRGLLYDNRLATSTQYPTNGQMYAYITDYEANLEEDPPSISSYTGNFNLDSFTPAADENIIACVFNTFDYESLSAQIAIVSFHR